MNCKICACRYTAKNDFAQVTSERLSVVNYPIKGIQCIIMRSWKGVLWGMSIADADHENIHCFHNPATSCIFRVERPIDEATTVIENVYWQDPSLGSWSIDSRGYKIIITCCYINSLSSDSGRKAYIYVINSLLLERKFQIRSKDFYYLLR